MTDFPRITELPVGLPKLDPDVRLHGTVDDKMVENFLEGVEGAAKAGTWVVEVNTSGGDADAGRRIAAEVRLLQKYRGTDLVFIGKTAVYSAGVTIMSAFPPNRRFLHEGTLLLIHERRLEKTLTLSGAMRASQARVRDVLAEIESALALEREDFAALVRETKLPLDDLLAHVYNQDWYVKADEAEKLGLVAGLF